MNTYNPRNINFLFKSETVFEKTQEHDTLWQYVRLLMLCDNGLTDERGHIFQVYGTRPPEFNRGMSIDARGCISLLGNSNASTDYSSAYTPGNEFSITDTDNAAIEFWARFSSIPTVDGNVISNQRMHGTNAANWRIFVNSLGKMIFRVGDSNTVNEEVLSSLDYLIPDANWNHYAYVKIGKTIHFYFNGNLQASQSYSMTMGARNDRQFSIGSEYNSWNYIGVDTPGAHAQCYLDDVRVTIGAPRYTQPFDVTKKTLYTYGGAIKDINGQPIMRLICLYRRTNGELINSMTSNSNGAWSLSTPHPDAHFVVAIDTTQNSPTSILKDWL